MTYSPEGPGSGGAGSPGYGSGGYGGYGSSPGSSPQQHNPESQYGQPYSQPSYGQGHSPYSQNPYSQPGQPGQPSQPGQQNQPSHTPQSGSYNPVLASAKPSPLPRILTLVVVAFGIVNLFAGLAGQYSAFDIANNFFLPGNGDPTSIALLFASGLVAAVGLLPKQPNTLGISAALAFSGWIVLVFQAFNIGNNGGIGSSIGLGAGALTVLVFGFLQTAAAVAATLFASEILKAPAPKPVSYGQQNPFQGYGQQNPQAQNPQAQNPQGQNPQGQGYGYGQPQQSYGSPSQGGYAPPTYSGPSGTQNTTGSLGYPVGESSQPGSSGLTGPASQNSPYSQYQYGQPPVGASGQGAAQHAVPPESDRDDESGSDQPPYSAPTQAFGTTPDKDEQK
ncbi:DUF5336 domain-containing protein [Rhodococcoides kyotonense]|uniref:Uncharacterized membrane protein YphA, DoxX/SURF4 family n=1 Tax=Rhodococcoides kyotonense TaxID=398843 RepID=A0A239EIE1_9NOCA|nr:DUF5336 domain-containing protein [Rhodococcus kyotonensis]SNS44416.1 Uncharacterized membrane protein YphA, DoxX/SURF4 family [Rhodococcus kyotonensis]